MTPEARPVVEPLTGQRSATAEFVLGLGRLLGWPHVELAGETLGDRDVWRFAVPRATPAQRADVVAALRSALLRATPEGLTRLRAARERPTDADTEPLVIGDAAAVEIVRAALALAPIEVRTVATREAAFIPVGRDSLAWTASSLFLDVANRQKDRIVALGPRANVWVVLHELGHVWHAPTYEHPEDRFPAVSAVGELGLRAYAKQTGWFSDMDKNTAEAELLADGCALSWVLAPAGSRVS